MNKISPILLGLSLAVAGSSIAAAQQPASMPKVLQITREFIKPYKSGAAHDKTESAFLTAMTKAKFPAYYLGLDSLSGKSRALFLTGYDSFDTWEKDNKLVDKNPALAAELERASVADGELLDEVDSGVFVFSEDLSYKPHADISHARYIEITEFHIRLGHTGDWHKLTKLYKEAQEKAGTSAHWATYEAAYGANDGTYLSISGDESMANIDNGYGEDSKKFAAALGEEGMKQLDKLYGETVESANTQLFSINPKQSYVSEDMIKADPDFWKPKPAAKPVAKPAVAPLFIEKKTP
jgi:hypothetical protein